MMTQMKLILERWENFIVEEFDACDTSFNVGDFKLAVDISKYLGDQEKLNQREKEIAQDGHWRNYLAKAKKIAIPLAKLGVAGVGVATSAPVAIAGTGAAMAASAVGAGIDVAEGGEAAKALGRIFMLGSTNENNNTYQQFLETFCVDQQTLDLIEDKFQKVYIQESDVVDELKTYFDSANDEAPLPDITNHLVDWLNNQSAYAKTDDTKLVAT